jgi:predicted metal-dependent phosphoesterase TrpH
VSDILTLAKKLDLGAISICDHDTIAAQKEAMALAPTMQLNYIPAVEMTTDYKEMFLHLLGYYLNVDDEKLTARLDELEKARWEQAWARVANLRTLGFSIDDEEFLRQANGKPPVGPIIARALFAHPANAGDPRLEPYLPGGVRSQRPFYYFDKDWMHEGKPAYAPAHRPDIYAAIRFMRGLSIVPVLAHPGEKFDHRTCSLVFAGYRDAGLVGLEAYSSYHTPEQTEGFLVIARELGLIVTCGSDYHGYKIKPNVDLGMIRVEGAPILRALEEARDRCQNSASQYS